MLLGILVGLWIGVPVGIVLVALMGPRDQEGMDPRALHDLLARHYPTDPALASQTPGPALAAPGDDDIATPGRRLAR